MTTVTDPAMAVVFERPPTEAPIKHEAFQRDPHQRLLSVELLSIDGFNRPYVNLRQLLQPDLADDALIVQINAASPGYRDSVRDPRSTSGSPSTTRFSSACGRGGGS